MTRHPSVLTFGEWLALNPEAKEEEEKCNRCLGDGEVECEECGHERPCPDCKGRGFYRTARTIYDEQRKRDLRLWGEYAEATA